MINNRDNTFTREEIEHTLINLIRQRAVALGYLPDVTLFAGNKAGYLAARQAIIDSGKELIDVFGIGSADERGEKTYHRITLNLRQYNNGSITHYGDSIYQDDGSGGYNRVQGFASSRNILYDIRSSVSGPNSTQYDRICLELVMSALGTLSVGKYLPTLVNVTTGEYDSDRRFLCAYNGSQEIKGTDFFERLMTYEIIDIFLRGVTDWNSEIPTSNIVPLGEIEGSGGPDGDPPQTIINVK